MKENFTSHLITKVEAAPWPYIPADLLPIFIALGVQGRRPDDVLEQGLRRRADLAHRAVACSARTPCCAIRTA